MKLFIKNILTEEDKEWLRNTLNELSISYEQDIVLGELVVAPGTEPEKLVQLKTRLLQKNLVILHDRKTILSEQLKLLVFDMFRPNQPIMENYSVYISNRMQLNYTYLANIFSELNGITIEHYIINQKLEVAKQLLLSGDYNIGEIADALNYSSIGHFSNQFKKVTGINPSEFKKKEKETVTQ